MDTMVIVAISRVVYIPSGLVEILQKPSGKFMHHSAKQEVKLVNCLVEP